MNDKHDLLLTEAIDLIGRAKDLIDLLRAEERRREAWALQLNTLSNTSRTRARHLGAERARSSRRSRRYPRPGEKARMTN